LSPLSPLCRLIKTPATDLTDLTDLTGTTALNTKLFATGHPGAGASVSCIMMERALGG
jgi:hypothetical protein